MYKTIQDFKDLARTLKIGFDCIDSQIYWLGKIKGLSNSQKGFVLTLLKG